MQLDRETRARKELLTTTEADAQARTQLQADVADLTQASDAARSDLEAAQHTIQAMQRDVAALHAELTASTQARDSACAELAAMQARDSTEARALERRNADASELAQAHALQRRNAEASELVQARDASQADLAAARSDLVSAQAFIRELQDRAAAKGRSARRNPMANPTANPTADPTANPTGTPSANLAGDSGALGNPTGYSSALLDLGASPGGPRYDDAPSLTMDFTGRAYPGSSGGISSSSAADADAMFAGAAVVLRESEHVEEGLWRQRDLQAAHMSLAPAVRSPALTASTLEVLFST